MVPSETVSGKESKVSTFHFLGWHFKVTVKECNDFLQFIFAHGDAWRDDNCPRISSRHGPWISHSVPGSYCCTNDFKLSRYISIKLDL